MKRLRRNLYVKEERISTQKFLTLRKKRFFNIEEENLLSL